MTRIFRNIRQKLAAENKVMAYLRYAIGEILLVVIGILIALQVNNWNERRKDRKEEQVLLQNLKEEFTKNLDQLHSDHAINMGGLEAAHYFLENNMQLKTPRQIDSLVGKLTVYATFDASVGYIDQAISSGKLDLIESDKLKIYLSQWSGELNDLKEDVIIRRDHWLHYLLPIIRKYLPTRNTDAAQYRPDYIRKKAISPRIFPEANYKEFTKSLEVDGIIFDHYMNQYYVIINEQHIESYINQILDLINEELKN